MVIYNKSGNIIPQGRVTIERVYDDFSAEYPGWLNIEGSKSVNSNDSLVLTKGALSAIKISSKLYLFSGYDAIQLELGNYMKNTLSSMDGFYIESEDLSSKIEIKNVSTAANSDIGIYQDGVLIETIKQLDLTWNISVNKPCTYTINYNTQHGSLTLLSNGCVIREVFLPAKLPLNKKYKIGFNSTSSTITISQIILKLWKSI
ncbi:hypothetical protein [Empedobacter brevis]|uniref:hypothetical protein n=1 Tax=Empedobacter brevis TaxID=247 RepID=UPI00289849AF|nr:hypothetical protein [Empedobacter brevis]